jgi:rubrerythrin
MNFDDSVKDLALAYAGLVAAAARNRLYAARLRKDARTPSADLLIAVAGSEEVQSRRILMHLRGKISDPQIYISELAQNKFKAYSNQFPKISSLLRQAGQRTAAEAVEQFGEVAQNHYDLLVAARETETQTDFYICQVCGYIAVDEPPLKCPVCGAVRSKFKPSV